MEDEWTTLTNADFIQPGINITMRSQTQNDTCIQNLMNNNICDASCSPMFSDNNPSLYHSPLPTPGLGQYQPLVTATPTYNEMTEVPPMEISPPPASQRSPSEQFSSQPLMMSISPMAMSSSQHSPVEPHQLSPQPYKSPKSEPSELANILKGEAQARHMAWIHRIVQTFILQEANIFLRRDLRPGQS